MWQLLIIAYLLLGTANILLRRVIAKDLSEYAILLNSFFFLFFLLPAGFILSIFVPHNLDVGWENILIILIGSIVWPLAGITAFFANKKTDAGVYSVINNISPAFTLILALVFLNENLTSQQYLGIALLIIAGIVAASTQVKKHFRTSTFGILFCILTAILFGVGVAYERFMLTRIDLGAYLIFGWGAQVVWCLIFSLKETNKINPFIEILNKNKRIILSWCFTNISRATVFILALSLSSASILSAVNNFIAVTVVFSAYFLLKEKEHMFQKIVSAGIGAIGLFLVAK